MFSLRTVWTILLISATTFPQGLTLYFTQSQVQLTPRQLVKPNETLYSLTATLDPDDSGSVYYSMNYTEPHCSNLDIDPNSGSLFLRPGRTFDQDIRSGALCRYTIEAILKGQPGLRGKKKSQMTLVVNKIKGMAENIDCSALTKAQLCFGDYSTMEFAVMENSEELTVAPLGLDMKNCVGLKLKYSVVIDEDVLFVRRSAGTFSPFELTTRSNLNRESQDSFTFSLQCSLVSEQNEAVELKINGTLIVLDMDDNPPVTQTGLQHQTVFVSFLDPSNTFKTNSRIFAMQSSQLLVVDKDTVDVNDFRVLVLNDTKNFLRVEKIIVPFKHSAPNAIPATFVYLRIYLTDKVEGVRIWKGLYCVAVSVNDTTLVPGHGNSVMTFHFCLHWDDNEYETIVVEPRLSLAEVNSIFNNGIFQGTFSRRTLTSAPVLYAFRELIRDVSDLSDFPIFDFAIENFQVYNHDQEDITAVYTNIEEYSGGSPFEISPKMGIVYSKDPHLVKNSEVHLVVLNIMSNVSFGTNITGNSTIHTSRTNISIYIEGKMDTKTDVECEHLSCAEFSEQEKCTSSCGFGASGICYWDQPMNNSVDDGQSEDEILVRKYTTCTPLPQSCPDARCDEVEKLFPLLCPQDCAEELNGIGHLRNRRNGMKYGIGSGIGVCSCHGSISCSCGYLPTVMSTSFSKSSGDHRVEAARDSQTSCDQNCIVFLTAAGLLCVVTLAGVSYLWRIGALYRKKPLPVKRALIPSGSHSEDNSANNILPGSDYLGPEHGQLVPMGFNSHMDSYLMVDSKWEIARSELALEQILGEGEFGRVLKGRVHDSDGYERHSAVAVKMLKEHAENGKSSRQEFMAEFSLLKQVDHPNVVKLLGACTSAGGPPYLILEFAEFGSLRSFLRRCRQAENLVNSPNLLEIGKDLTTDEPIDFDPKKYVVTPSEILGFSWQIAKGMVYLSDMKMVHRDLAARNILLTEDKVCKISDFGLTRDIYVDDAYRKKSKDRVPVKWLAPECLEDEFYTSKSDVWAYGVLLWELATLGASPYPGIQTEHLYSLLKSGYRMEQPVNCSLEMYGLMRQCWINEPQLRPSFRQLETSLAKLLEDGIEYLRLDIPTVSNPGYEYFSQNEDLRLKIENTVM